MRINLEYILKKSLLRQTRLLSVFLAPERHRVPPDSPPSACESSVLWFTLKGGSGRTDRWWDGAAGAVPAAASLEQQQEDSVGTLGLPWAAGYFCHLGDQCCESLILEQGVAVCGRSLIPRPGLSSSEFPSRRGGQGGAWCGSGGSLCGCRFGLPWGDFEAPSPPSSAALTVPQACEFNPSCFCVPSFFVCLFTWDLFPCLVLQIKFDDNEFVEFKWNCVTALQPKVSYIQPHLKNYSQHIKKK